MTDISINIQKLLKELPPGVQLVAAVKNRTPAEITAAVRAGITILGENYVQEAAEHYTAVGRVAQWHCIGHLQKNKIKKAVEIFDMIQTVDSLEMAREIDKRCQSINKIMPILIEVNSGRELRKSGVLPEDVAALAQSIAAIPNIRLMGLMTMGPAFGDPAAARPYFVTTRQVFEDIKARYIPNVTMQYLSMGMTNSYQVALREGANIVRLGTLIFGQR
ncbi:MAG: YggS family pyridoxal phosphate-dependent enzyme [Dehalococcoidales bacterium]